MLLLETFFVLQCRLQKEKFSIETIHVMAKTKNYAIISYNGCGYMAVGDLHILEMVS